MRKPFQIILLVLLACYATTTCLAEQEQTDAASNFVLLLQSTWKEVVWFGGVFALKVLAASSFGGLLGLGCGIALYILLRKRGAFRAPWRWYRFASWLWAPLFALSLSIAGGHAGVWLGGGNAAIRAIKKDLVVRKVAANLYCAIALDKANYRVKGSESVVEIVDLIAQGEELADATLEGMGKYARDLVLTDLQGGDQDSWLHQFLLRHVGNEKLGTEVFRDLFNSDPRVMIAMFYMFAMDNTEYQAYVQANPGRAAFAAAIATMCSRLEQEVSDQLNTWVWSNVVAGIMLGLAIPLGLLAIFRGVVYGIGKHDSERNP